MGLLLKRETTSPSDHESEERARALRRMMQDIVIAHAIVCHKHMNAEQIGASQQEWAKMVKGKGWTPFFVGDDFPLPGPSEAVGFE